MEKPVSSYFERPGYEVLFRNTDESGLLPTVVIRRDSPQPYTTSFRYHAAAFTNDLFWRQIHSKLQTLLYHHVQFPDAAFQNEEAVLAFVNSHHPRLSPAEKLESLLEYIQLQTVFDGQTIRIDLLLWDEEELFRRFFMAHGGELRFYIRVLKESGDIWFDDTAGSELFANITLKGLTKLATIEERKNSRICFVAMSFAKELESVYVNAIAPAIIENNFIPLLQRDVTVNGDTTINDAILAGLKKARFTLADFTGHRVNVYFEAGFALGRGQKVIYSCREDQVELAGFDTRNYQHLVWKDEADFRKKLSNKIQAYIIE